MKYLTNQEYVDNTIIGSLYAGIRNVTYWVASNSVFGIFNATKYVSSKIDGNSLRRGAVVVSGFGYVGTGVLLDGFSTVVDANSSNNLNAVVATVALSNIAHGLGYGVIGSMIDSSKVISSVVSVDNMRITAEIADELGYKGTASMINGACNVVNSSGYTGDTNSGNTYDLECLYDEDFVIVTELTPQSKLDNTDSVMINNNDRTTSAVVLAV